MVKRMLIDASHAEETRVVVASGTRLEEFDYESSTREQLKGNIYLAKVMRVEPSLQAAFVDYGGNRHGFLPFSEIHPDYYQIPVADREALFEEQEAAVAEADRDGNGANGEFPSAEDTPADGEEAAGADEPADSAEVSSPAGTGDGEDAESANDEAEAAAVNRRETSRGENGGGVETLGGDEIDDIERRRLQVSRSLLSRRYKIQEVVKKRQIMLVQVVKEERGTKGAALTTYLSLAGRYCVLMPNAIRGGGISRKIVHAEDRRRLKAITSQLEIPPRMGVIMRTAGVQRSRSEIKRDFDYLLRQWENIREDTLKSTAPTLIYEEANLIKRSIRDLYTKDIDQILVEGEKGYRVGKDFMRTLIPSHSRKVQLYRDRIPLYARYQVEGQLDAMYSPEVQLRSGGYLVINATEALVAIDVNSGRATKERNIEETALRTNLEAAEEIARQLRLRDLAGLIVIDFIDMDEIRNQRAVERRFKEAVRSDRARIQIGRISPFGLLELSRQRLRPSLVEASMEICAICAGAGVVRSVASSAVHVLRAVEEEGLRNRSAEILVRIPAQVAVYILNHKRQTLAEIEERYGFHVGFAEDEGLVPPNYTIERVSARSGAEDTDAEERAAGKAGDEDEAREAVPAKKRRRRRKPRAADADQADRAPGDGAADAAEDAEADVAQEAGAEDGEDGASRPKRRRRGKRGGRRRSAKAKQTATSQDAPEDTEADERSAAVETDTEAAPAEAQSEDAPAPRKRRSRRPGRAKKAAAASAEPEAAEPQVEAAAEVEEVAEPEHEAEQPEPAEFDVAPPAPDAAVAEPATVEAEQDGPTEPELVFSVAPDVDEPPASVGRPGSAHAPVADDEPAGSEAHASPTASGFIATGGVIAATSASGNGPEDGGEEDAESEPSDELGDVSHQGPRRGWWQRMGRQAR